MVLCKEAILPLPASPALYGTATAEKREAKRRRRASPLIGTGAVALARPKRSAYEDLRAFSQFLAKRLMCVGANPVVCVVGNSASLLTFFYQTLPVALLSAEQSICQSFPRQTKDKDVERRTIRLVTHELASKGLEYCSFHRQYMTISPEGQAENPSEVGVSRVLWCVPRIVTNAEHVDALLSLWSVPPVPRPAPQSVVDVQTILFLNTDIVEESFLTDVEGGGLFPGNAPSRRLPSVLEGHIRVSRQFIERLPAYCQGRWRAEEEGGRGAFSPCPPFLPDASFPALYLSSLSPFLDYRRSSALTALQEGADLSLFFRHSVSANAQSTLLPLQSVGGWRGGAAFTRAPVSHFLQPSIYGDAKALAAGGREAVQRNREASVIVQSLHDTQSRTREPVAGGVAAEPSAVVRRYYPLLSHVGDLLRKRCCLSDVYVLQLALNDDVFATSVEQWRRKAPGTAADAALFEATMDFSLRQRPATRRRLARCLSAFVDTACVARRAFSWALDPEESAQAVRVAVCFSYEVFSGEAIAPLLEQERALVREHARLRSEAGTGGANGALPLTASVPREEELPTTLGYLVKKLLGVLRERGWALVHQESHHTWDSACDGADAHHKVSASASVPGPWALRERVISSADGDSAERRRLREEHRARMKRLRTLPCLIAERAESVKESSRLTNGDFVEPTGCTSKELWQAALASSSFPEEGLSLWKGAKVLLPNGRRGVVVGFASPPQWASQAASLRSPPSWRMDSSSSTTSPSSLKDSQTAALVERHKAFIEWLRAAPTSPYRWKPCLPAFVSEMEQRLWPVVQFLDNTKQTLVLPSLVVQYRVRYPTLCFVSEAQQRATAEAALPPPASHRMGGGGGEQTRPSPRHRFPRETSERDDEWGLPPLHTAHFYDAAWMLQAEPSRALDAGAHPCAHSAEGATVTMAALPLKVHIGETPASLFYASVLLCGSGGTSLWHKAPRSFVGGASVFLQQSLQSHWRALHVCRRKACLRDASMGAVAPTPLSLQCTRWQLHVGSFLGKPRALRCVVASLPNVGNVTLDNAAMLSFLHKGVFTKPRR